ncbi:MAG: hypothetical protein JNK05_15845 [Myxococcales bacterium]|nr:hypothetical protein [Myxococcales bacterium]
MKDPGVDRGIENIIRNYLCVTAGERVALLHWKAPELVALFEEALVRNGATVARVDLASRASVPPGSGAGVAEKLRGCTASMLLAAQEFPMALSYATREAVRAAKTRHLHLAGLDLRVLAQSARAEPSRLELIGARVVDAVLAAGAISVVSDNGTSLEVRCAKSFPLVIGTGRPSAGGAENIPAGFVYWHPSDVRGTFIADRGLALSGLRIATRRAPVTLVIEASRVREYDCTDAETCAKIDEYFTSHANASRVGTVVFPTNYLVRSEIGVHAQDELSPGLNINLGFSHSPVTRAPWDAPVQARLLARKLSVRAGDRALVDNGRHADALVESVDPFR